jgi:hypothetical protein
MNFIKVYLTPEEMSKCWTMAKDRHKTARKLGSVCRLEQGQEKNPIKVDAIGLYGEVAYCKAFGLDTALVFEDERQDLFELQKGDVFHNGHWVDIKASEWKTAKLIYPVEKQWRCKADYLCLVTVFRNECMIRGFASKENFMASDNIGNIGKSRDLYIMKQDRLTFDVPMNHDVYDYLDPRNGEG